MASERQTCTYNSGCSIILPHHQEYLVKRGVSLALAMSAGVRSVTADEIRELAPPYGGDAGGLLIPYPGAEPTYNRVRLDKGPARFHAPALEVPIYVPPVPIENQDQPLVIVEGAFKSLSLAGAGLRAVGLGGTGTTLEDTPTGRRLNFSWGVVQVRGRPVTALFDSNRRTNLCVVRDEIRLVLALEQAGAYVSVADLPASDDGSHWGPDDYLAVKGAAALEAVIAAAVPGNPLDRVAAIGALEPEAQQKAAAHLLDDAAFLLSVAARGMSTVEQIAPFFDRFKMKAAFRRVLKDVERELHAAQSEQLGALGERYEVRRGHLCHIRLGEEREYCDSLANFAAEIEREIIIDDGVERHRRFVVRGELASGEPLPTISVPATEFDSGEWVLREWGANAVVEAGRSACEHLRVAIQRLSTPSTERVLAHTGWHEADGVPVFVHADGAVGGEYAVELDSTLQRYRLPREPEDALGAWRVALELLDLGPKRITVPLLLAAARAPLCSALPVDFLVVCHGTTGNFKSTVVALFLSLFGAFTHDALPASFNDTLNALERKLSIAKDVPLVIDEWVPRSTDASDEARRKADGLAKLVGNRAPRARLRADTSARPVRMPRGLVIATGEELPTGESTRARCFSIAFNKGDINANRLTQAQALSPRLAHAMQGFLSWLRRRLSLVRIFAEKRFPELRAKFESGDHRRGASSGAHLMLGGEVLIEYLVDVGVLSASEAAGVAEGWRVALGEALEAQQGDVKEERPGTRVVETLRALVDSGRARLLPPPTLLNADPNAIGWIKGAELWLDPTLTYNAMQRFLKEHGDSFQLKAPALWRALRDEGLLRGSDSEHVTVQKVLADPVGKRVRVLVLPSSVLEPPGAGVPGARTPPGFIHRSKS